MDYKFAKAASACTTCGRAFEDRERFLSALREPVADDDSAATDEPNPAAVAEVPDASGLDERGFVRLDICMPCWAETWRDPIFSWWQNKKAPSPRKPPTDDPEFLWALLSQTRPHADMDAPAGGRDIHAAGHAYVAALGLLRLKHLKLARHFRMEGQEFLVFTGRGSRRHELVILDPGYSDEQFVLVEEQLTALQSVFLGIDAAVAEEEAAQEERRALNAVDLNPLVAAAREKLAALGTTPVAHAPEPDPADEHETDAAGSATENLSETTSAPMADRQLPPATRLPRPSRGAEGTLR